MSGVRMMHRRDGGAGGEAGMVGTADGVSYETVRQVSSYPTLDGRRVAPVIWVCMDRRAESFLRSLQG